MCEAIRLFAVAGLLIFVTSSSFGHARWFINDQLLKPTPRVEFDGFHFGVLALILGCVFGMAVVEYLARRNTELYRVMIRPAGSLRLMGWRLLCIAFGSTLIINSMTSVFVAPNLAAGKDFGFQAMMFLQILIGSMFVLQAELRFVCIFVLVLPFFCWWMYSLSRAIDYAFELVGVGAAIYLIAPVLPSVGVSLKNLLRNLAPRDAGISVANSRHTQPDAPQPPSASATKVLRVFLGLQLIILALHDKLLQPEVSLAFVDRYPFVNFPVLLGLKAFSNLHFVFSAGLAEAALGSLLVANIGVRPVSLLLAILFAITAALFGVEEVLGHSPIFAAFMLLIIDPGASVAVREAALPGFSLRAGFAAVVIMLLAIFAAAEVARGPSSTAPNGIVAVPELLYRQFSAHAAGKDLTVRTDLAMIDAKVARMFDDAKRGLPIDKDLLARELLELSVRYEAAFGRDAASLWLRYGHLTA
ncbi:MAG TPA: hypothetical protein VE986_05445, partial [Hyphomicrobiales bacterium]|nr:hypothetical protein [Hyphomicrobiales bacterium]